MQEHLEVIRKTKYSPPRTAGTAAKELAAGRTGSGCGADVGAPQQEAAAAAAAAAATPVCARLCGYLILKRQPDVTK